MNELKINTVSNTIIEIIISNSLCSDVLKLETNATCDAIPGPDIEFEIVKLENIRVV